MLETAHTPTLCHTWQSKHQNECQHKFANHISEEKGCLNVCCNNYIDQKYIWEKGENQVMIFTAFLWLFLSFLKKKKVGRKLWQVCLNSDKEKSALTSRTRVFSQQGVWHTKAGCSIWVFNLEGDSQTISLDQKRDENRRVCVSTNFCK